MERMLHTDPSWWVPFGGLLWIVVLAALIWLLVRSVGPRPLPPPRTARDILDERFARGEISSEEYRERLDALRSDR